MIYDHPLIDRIYRASPLVAQNALVSAYGVLRQVERFTPVYRRYIRELAESQWWSPERLQAMQEERLAALVRHAYENVPYYRRVMDERGLRPADVRTAADLVRLPILRKEDVRRHAADLRARNVPDRLVTTGRTGGTTGVPLAFALDHARVMFDHALIERHWGWAGCRPRDRVALVRGLTLVPASDRTGAFWRHDYVNNRVYVSGFHMSADRLPEYVERLREWRVPYYSAYPSTIAFLARYLERENLTIPARAIFTSSEVLTPTERAVIERRFECRVWDRYGTGERLVVSQQCEHGSYHQNVEYGLLEVVSPEGEPVPTGVRGALLHTGLTNLSMPLLRYAIEDVGYVVDGQCVCGRGLAMMGAVDGRKDDAIITSDGRVMPQAGLDQIHEFVERMERCQLVQERVGEVIVRVQPRAGFDASDAEELVAQLRKRVGEGTVIRVVTVDALELTATGKERFIVSRLTAEEREEADRAALRS